MVDRDRGRRIRRAWGGAVGAILAAAGILLWGFRSEEGAGPAGQLAAPASVEAPTPAPEPSSGAPSEEAAKSDPETAPAFGSVEIRFRVQGPALAARIRAVLLPPLAGLRDWSRSWGDDRARAAADLAGITPEVARAGLPLPLEREPDGSGIVRWDTVPAAPDYRWGLLDPGLYAEMDPLYEDQLVKLTDRGFSGTGASEPPDGLSGKFAVPPGGTVRFEATVRRKGGVRGRLLDEAGIPAPSATVKLYLRRTYRHPRGARLTSTRYFAHGLSSEEGVFAFSDVPDGAVEVNAVLERPVHEYLTWAADGVVAPGMEWDLGDINPLAGHSQRILVAIEGRGIEPSEIPVAERPKSAVLDFVARPDESVGGPEIGGMLQVPVGEPVVLHGLPLRGHILIRALRAPGQPSEGESYLWLNAEPETVALPSETDLKVPLTAVGVSRTIVRLSTPADAHPGRCQIVPLGEDGRELAGVRTAIQPGGTASVELKLPRGRWRLLVSSAVLDPFSETNLYGECLVDLEGAVRADADVVLAPGAIIRGRIFQKDGTPSEPGGMCFTPEETGASLYQFQVGPEGRFILRGVRPRERLVTRMAAGQVFEAGEAGTTREVLVRYTR